MSHASSTYDREHAGPLSEARISASSGTDMARVEGGGVGGCPGEEQRSKILELFYRDGRLQRYEADGSSSTHPLRESY